MMPSNWSPTCGCLRVSRRASCSSRRFRQIQRWAASGHEGTAADDPREEGEADPGGRLTNAVEGEEEQKGDADAKDGPGDRLDHFDRPDLLLEAAELALQGRGQL